MTLAELSAGKSGVILTVGGEGALRCRLLDMGLIPKTEVKVIKIAPMGDPMELEIRGYSLSIRKEDAKKIEIKEGELPELSLCTGVCAGCAKDCASRK